MKHTFLLLALVAAMTAGATSTVSVRDQKILLTRDGQETVLAPQGTSESYYWVSLSPDEQHILYATAHHGTFVCDLNGGNVVALGRLNAPKWLDNEHVEGMQEHYTGHDEVDYTEYFCVARDGKARRMLTQAETQAFVAREEARLQAAEARNMLRAAAHRAATTGAEGLTGLKIYLNPGHGGYDANDRSCWTIPVPETWTNPAGYWESKSNLVKALALKEMLEEAGATVIISRTTNNSGSRDIDYYNYAVGSAEYNAIMNGDDRDLSAIAEEANANSVDHFLSIHSNALNTQTNYLLMLYHGENGLPTVPTSDQMAASSGAIQIQNPLTVWTSGSPLLRGDITFYGDSPSSPTAGLGVLRPLTVPGFLSEGSFHDYAPETHRLMNYDYCRLEALRMYQHFHRYFGRTLPQTACISGWVKSANQKVDELGYSKFYYVPNSDDQWMPLNEAVVVLSTVDGTPVDTVMTDDWYNGVFAFYDLQPGTYVVTAAKAGYTTKSDTVTVVAEQIAGVKMRLSYTHIDAESYPEPELNGVLALSHYDFVADGAATAVTVCPDRVLYREGQLFTLENGRVVRRNMHYAALDTLPQPAGLMLADIAFSADGFLMASVAATGSLNVYMWENMAEPCTLFFTTEMEGSCGNTLAVNGSYWKGEYFTMDGTSLKKVVYAEGLTATTTTTTLQTGLAADARLVAAPAGGAVAGGAMVPAFFRYAGHVMMVQPEAGGFRLMDATNASAPVAVSDLITTANSTAAQAFVWLEGYDMHIGIVGCNGGYETFTSVTKPMANIYAGELAYKNNTFSFRLNEDATSVTLAIEKDGNQVGSQELGALEKGAHEVANTFGTEDFDAMVVTASAPAVGYPACISDNTPVFQFYAPRGVAVDKSETSPYFGRVYVTESLGGAVSSGAPVNPRTTTQGVYVLSSDFEDITEQGAAAWNGGITWGENKSGENYQFALARPSVAPDGDVYVASTAFASAGLYVMNPAAPDSAFTAVFDGKRNKSTGALKTGSTIICNPVMHSVVLGMGAEKKLYTFDRNNSLGTVYGSIFRYDLGNEALPWKTAPSEVVFDDMNTGSHMQNASGQIAYDQRGGFFLSQYRYNSSVAIPSLIHVKNGVVDYNCGTEIATSQQGGMGVSADGNLVAIGREVGIVAVYEVTYNAAGVPSLKEKYVIDWGNGAGNTMGVDFDAAGNLYIVSNSNERLMVYSLPKVNNTFTSRHSLKAAPVEDALNDVHAADGASKVLMNGQLYINRDGRTYSVMGIELK